MTASSSSLRILVLGYIVRQPLLGGMAWHYLQYLLGLTRLGHEVYYLEDSGDFPGAIDPASERQDRDPRAGLRFLGEVMTGLGHGDRWAYYDASRQQWHGGSLARTPEQARTADLLINVSGVNPVRDWMLAIPVRLLIDTDPVFTQIRHLGQYPNDNWASLWRRSNVNRHTHFFTFGENIGRPGCDIPVDGYPWQPTRQPVVLDAWPVTPAPADGRFTTVMNWWTYPPLRHGGVTYSTKPESFVPYIDLPKRVREPFELMVAGPQVPREVLLANGWSLRNPAAEAGDPWTYREYLQRSKAEFGIAKQGYVVTRSGWFSERSAAYLASGRPIVVQETGFSEWMKTGEGVLRFSSPEEAVAAVHEVNAHYPRHCRAARAVAEEYFDSDKVLSDLLDRAAVPAAGVAAAPNTGSSPGTIPATDPAPLVDALTRHVPAGHRFVLLDQQVFGLDRVAGRQALPFLERDGRYFGLPSDSATAILEIERMRRGGASHLVVTQPCFWCLDHYSEWHQHLQSRYPCPVRNNSLVMFDLRTPTVAAHPGNKLPRGDRYTMRARKAFTLIELLVVITIIGLLAAILLPALKLAREKARGAQCLGNLKQIGLAVMMYGDDHGLYPYGRSPGAMPDDNQWDFIIGGYLNAGTTPYGLEPRSAVFTCPSAKKPGTWWRRLTYSANMKVCSDFDQPPQVSFASVTRPDEVILAGDSTQYSADGSSHAVLWGVRNNAGTQIKTSNGNVGNAERPIRLGNDDDATYPVLDPDGGTFRYRHAGPSANVVHGDGHARTFTKGKILERHLYTNY